MTEEKLKRINQINDLLKVHIVALSNIEESNRVEISTALYCLLKQDKKFRITFEDAISEVKSRLIKEFNEL